MSDSNFEDVGDFHAKFGLPTAYDDTPRDKIDIELMDFRVRFLHEELEEFEKGLAEGDHAQMADALIDLVYVAMGTAHFLGYPWHELWDDVQAANMRKVRAVSADESKRGSTWDVVKPAGWVGPRTADILREAM